MNEPEPGFLAEMSSLGMDFAKLEKEGKFAYVDDSTGTAFQSGPKKEESPSVGGNLAM